jgi:hypothetical protein
LSKAESSTIHTRHARAWCVLGANRPAHDIAESIAGTTLHLSRILWPFLSLFQRYAIIAVTSFCLGHHCSYSN